MVLASTTILTPNPSAPILGPPTNERLVANKEAGGTFVYPLQGRQFSIPRIRQQAPVPFDGTPEGQVISS